MNGRMRKNANAITSSCFVGVIQWATIKIENRLLLRINYSVKPEKVLIFLLLIKVL